MSGSTGRKKDFIWNNFEEVKCDQRKGTRAKCKICNNKVELNLTAKQLQPMSKGCFPLFDLCNPNCAIGLE